MGGHNLKDSTLKLFYKRLKFSHYWFKKIWKGWIIGVAYKIILVLKPMPHAQNKSFDAVLKNDSECTFYTFYVEIKCLSF